jgi:exodeoxyribonuclease VIII
MALLEPARFASTYAVEPNFGDCRFKENKASKARWMLDHLNCTFLTDGDDLRIKGMLESLMAHPAASRIMTDGLSEVSLRWTDSATGLACKSRADYWVKTTRLVADLKSTEDASPRAFARSCAQWRYHVQDAQYRSGFDACGETIEFFAIIAIEKEPPYATAVYTLDQDAVARGYAAVRRNITTLQECLESGEFPSYSNGVEQLALPAWAA